MNHDLPTFGNPHSDSARAESALALRQGEKSISDTPKPLGGFATGALVRRRGAYVPASEVRATYESFCHAEGAEPANATAFGKSMTRQGFERAKVGGVMRYEGIAVSATSQTALRVVAEGDRRVPGPFSTKQLYP